nr:sugar transferase [uncultured Roseateles sp.]
MTDAAAFHSAEGQTAPSGTAIPVLSGTKPRFLHRLFEIAFAITVLLLSAPLMLLIALVIRLDGPGPVLFFQKRLGKNGRPFTFVKFRTLYADARQRFPELYAYQYSHDELADLKFKIDDDPRVTRCGVWLRKSSLDELPNFWNVLTGEMALVGPRPEIPEMLRYYHGEMLMKFSVRPGVTGPAQISGRGRLKFYETVQYDLEYVRQHSFRYDLKVLVKTLQKVVMHDGAF